MRVKRGINRTVYAMAFSAVLCLAVVMSAQGVPSLSDYDDVYLQLVTSNGDNWTQSGGGDSFNITVNNTNATLSIDEINITVPIGGDGNATFAVSPASISSSSGSWTCSNASTDGAGNVSLMRCNTTAAPLNSTSPVLVVSFNTTAPFTAGEDLYQWNVTVTNQTGPYNSMQQISSGVDGLAPSFSVFDANVTYFTTTVLMWSTVTDASLDNSTVSMVIVNASNSSQSFGAVTDELCTHLTSSTWNCTGSWAGTGDGNYTFNISAQDTSGNSNETSADIWFFHDALAPTVTLNYPVSNGWDADGNIEFNFTPYDTSGSLANCSLWVANSTGGEWTLNDTNYAPVNNQMNNITAYGFSTDADEQVQYIWNVRCWDSVANSSFASQNFTVNVGNRSNIIVQNITFDESVSPYKGLNITATVNIKNNGTADVTANNTAVRIYFDDDSSVTDNPILMNTSVKILNTSLASGEYVSIEYVLPVNGTEFGTYYLRAEADYTDIETAEQSNDDNSLTKTFSTRLNVTLNSIRNATDFNPNVAPGTNVSVNVTILYDNGSAVTGLSIYNISLYDTWTPRDAGRDEAAAVNTTLVAITSQGAGIYIINYTVPDTRTYTGKAERSNYYYNAHYAEYGSHSIHIMAKDNSTGHYYDSPTSNTDTYVIKAPYLYITNQVIDELPVDDYRDKDFYFDNIGTDNISGTVNYVSDENPSAPLDFDFAASGSFSGSDVDTGKTKTFSNIKITGKAAGNSNISINASYDYGGKTYWYMKIIDVTVINSTTSSENGGDSGGTGEVTPQYECIYNTSCDSDEWCDRDTWTCESLVCPSGYYAKSHECMLKPVYSVDITSFDDEVSLTQGESTTTFVVISNTGNEGFVAGLFVDEDIDGVESNVTPASASIEENGSANFTVTITTNTTAKVGKYKIYYVSTTSSTAEDRQEFTLIINPLPDAIEEIKNDYQNYTNLINDLVARFNAIKSQLHGENLTEMETKINETQTTFNSLKQAMESGDYAQAVMEMDQLTTLISSTNGFMSELGLEGSSAAFWNTVIIWIVVIFVAIGAVGLLLYMLLPAQGYNFGKGYSPQGRGSVIDKFRGAVMSIRMILPVKKPQTGAQIVRRYKPAYSSDYKKLSGGYKPPSRTVSEKMKKILGKKN